jgi:uncharacterized protein YbaR (Trm112 family)
MKQANIRFSSIYFKFFMMKELSEELLKILACPKCKGDLVYNRKNSELVCNESKLVFKVVDGVPNMLIDEALRVADLRKNVA